ncbi:hypothetical protein [uncultured Streptomyces sp.]|uniref:hypothetical protein n=1 Tax=uncultured Streptomyces sp. TaxID=174707 RepID=UPI00260D04E4|nr:hypothetical protein [uncultured Streptomyces sp.]
MRTTSRRPALVHAALVSVLLAAIAGCSSGDDANDGGDGGGAASAASGLVGGLAALAEDGGTRQVTYLDAEKVRKLSGSDPGRFSFVARPGGGLLSGHQDVPWAKYLAPDRIDTAVDTPEAGRWTGSFDATALSAALKSAGYSRSEEDGAEVWTHSGGSGVNFRVSADAVAYSATGDASLAAVSPEKGASLADDEEFRRAADCLGDVYRADFNPLDPAGPGRLAALGQRAASAAAHTEVLCFVVQDDDAAQRLATRLRSVVDEEAPAFDGTKVTVDGGQLPVVRAIVPDTAEQRPGRLINSDTELWTSVGRL